VAVVASLSISQPSTVTARTVAAQACAAEHVSSFDDLLQN
jgi:hypothetical protein